MSSVLPLIRVSVRSAACV